MGLEKYKPIGDLYCDYSLDLNSITKYCIREYYIQDGLMLYHDFPIEYSTIEQIDLGIDLASDVDITVCAGDYIINE